MGLLDSFSDPYNQRLFAAGLLDIGSRFSGKGGGGGNVAAMQKALAVQQAAEEKRKIEMYKLAEERRRYEQQRADREAVGNAWMVPEQTLRGPYGLTDDEMFYDHMTESGPGPKAEFDAFKGADLMRGKETTYPARLPETNEEILGSMNRAMATGVQFTPEGVALMKAIQAGVDPRTLTAGSSMVNPLSGETIASADPAKVQEMEYLQGDPQAFQQQMQLRGASAPQTNINTAGGKKFAQTQAEKLIGWADDTAAKGELAQQKISNLNRLAYAVDEVGTTGPSQETELALREGFSTIGINFDNNRLGDLQELNKSAGQFVKEELNAATGPQTDSDRAFLIQIMPGLGTETNAMKQGIDFMRSQAMLDQYYGKAGILAQQSSNNWADVRDGLQETRKRRMSTPAAAIVNGKPRTYAWFYGEAKKRSPTMSDTDIIQLWIDSTSGK